MVPTVLDPDLQRKLKKEDLHYTSDNSPGFFRQKIGKGIKYYDLDGKVITSNRTLKRIDCLVIPPAWKDVWVSPKENGHLQATGIDEKGRKQYLYHPDWIKISQQSKFDKMVDFGLSLPKIRSRIAYNLRDTNLDKKKILATIVWLLEHTFIRIGNEEYASENNSFGLTTLRNRHVEVSGKRVTFTFQGKSGVISHLEVSNKNIAKTIKKCCELPGYEIFKFIDEDGNKHIIDSVDVNEFLKDITKDDFTAKDFRTWGATNLSANSFYHLGNPPDEKVLKQNITQTVKKVAKHLNNTVSVCRNYYIHPIVISTYQKNILIPHFNNYSKSKKNSPGLSWDEHALIKLLQNN